MTNKIIKGKDLMLFDKDGHSYAYATNHTFSLTAETSDISSKDHGIWGAVEVSKYSWEITSENLFTSADYDDMFTAMLAGEAVLIRFGLKTTPTGEAEKLVVADGNTALPYWTSDTTYYEGSAVITSLTANANNGENATYSVTFTGSGPIKKISTGAVQNN